VRVSSPLRLAAAIVEIARPLLSILFFSDSMTNLSYRALILSACVVASPQKSPPNQLGLEIANLVEPPHVRPRYNAAPGQEHWVIRQNPKTGERTIDRLWSGLIPHWCHYGEWWDETGRSAP